MKNYTVIGYYDHDEQPYAGHVQASSVGAARGEAIRLVEYETGETLIVVGVIVGKHEVF